MNKKDAIKYLDKKGKLEDADNLTEDDEQEVRKIIKEGKIYGDPAASIS